jgi:hypothetical protein
MFRLKIVLTFVVCVLLLALVGYGSHQAMLAKAIEQDTDESLRRAATLVEQERQLAEATVLAKAQYVASGKDLYGALTKKYGAAPTPDPDGEEEGEEEPAKAPEVDPIGERHLAVHERLLRYDKEFQLYANGEGNDKRFFDMPLQWRYRTEKGSKLSTPDLYFAVDDEGIGVAAIGKDLFKWFGDDVGKTYPSLSKTLSDGKARTAIWRYSYDPAVKPGSRPLYIVAMVPIRPNRDDKAAGVLVVGSLINDGAAKNAKDLVAGVEGIEIEDAERNRVLESAPELAYYYEGKIVGSTFDAGTQKAIGSLLLEQEKMLEKEGAEKTATVEYDGSVWMARARALPGSSANKDKGGVLVLANLSLAQKPLRDPGTYTILAAVMLALLGSIVLLLFIQLFLKPIEQIESGIQEVIAGNKDYQFSYQGSNKTAGGLAHALNLMTAYLQGKPMPDDDNAGGNNWGDLGPGGGGGGGQKSGPSQVQGVSMADLMGKKPSDSGGEG